MLGSQLDTLGRPEYEIGCKFGVLLNFLLY